MSSTTNDSESKGKIVVCRDMGEEAMGILQQSGYEVSHESYYPILLIMSAAVARCVDRFDTAAEIVGTGEREGCKGAMRYDGRQGGR